MSEDDKPRIHIVNPNTIEGQIIKRQRDTIRRLSDELRELRGKPRRTRSERSAVMLPLHKTVQ